MQKYLLPFLFLTLLAFAARAQNVGIGVAAPSEKLHVGNDGGGPANFRLDGSFMPGNAAGAAGQLLESQGAGAPPVWVDPPSGGGGALSGKANYLGRWGGASGDELYWGMVQDDSTQVVFTQEEDVFTANPPFATDFVTIRPPAGSRGLFVVGDQTGVAAQTSGSPAVQGVTTSSATDSKAVEGLATSGSGEVLGVYGATSSSTDRAAGVRGEAVGNSGATWGVHGVSRSQSNFAYGVRGETVSPEDSAAGVHGRANGPGGSGVYGWAETGIGVVGTHAGEATTPLGGVHGLTFAENPAGSSIYSRGVVGEAVPATGLSAGVWGQTNSATPQSAGIWGLALDGGATETYGVIGETNGGAESVGVLGRANNISGEVYGVYGRVVSPQGSGVYGEADLGSGAAAGVRGSTPSASGYGVFGEATDPTGANYGVYGATESEAGYGVYGEARNASGVNYGLYGSAASGNAFGGYAVNLASSGPAVSLGAECFSPDDGATAIYANAVAAGASNESSAIFARNNGADNAISVWALAAAANGLTYGLLGQTNSEQGGASGIFGAANGNPSAPVYGVQGYVQFDFPNSAGIYGGDNVLGMGPSSAKAGVFAGSVEVSRDFDVVGTKNFKIDHPLDPENKYLRHVCPESPEPINIYTGMTTTGADSLALVQLPDYFMAINKNFRYQLTCVNQFAQAIVIEEIEANRFRIKTDKPGVKVSWTVYGERNDLYLQQNPFEAVSEKESTNKGKYLYPAGYGAPKEQSIFYAPMNPRVTRRQPARETPAPPARGEPRFKPGIENLPQPDYEGMGIAR